MSEPPQTPAHARSKSSLLFVAAMICGVLWTTTRMVPDDASDGLLVAVGLLKGPLFAAMFVCMGLAFRHRGWADGFEAARKETPDA